jgi:hypothetical protein
VKRLAFAVVLVLCASAPAAQATAPATVSGKLRGAKLPRAGDGRTVVWAMRIPDGRVLAGTSARSSGRFTLKPPGGSYAIVAAVVPERGRGNPLVRVADFVTAKAGKRRTIRPTLKRRHKRKRKVRAAAADVRARAAWVNVDYPMLWVHRWTAQGDPLLGVLEKGMQEMVITDLAAALGTPDCPGGVSAGDDMDKVLGEIKLTNSPYFDPSTRLTTAKLIRPNASVTGTMSRANGLLTITATYQDQRPGRAGRSGTVSVTGAEDNVFGLEQALIPKLVDLICAKTQKAYAGTFSGSWTTTLNSYRVTWTGDAVIELTAEHGSPPPDGPPPEDYAHYAVRSGRVHAILDGTRGNCSVHGEAHFDLPTGPITAQNYVQVGVEQPWFSLTITGRGDEAIPYTESGVGCNQVDPQYPLTGVLFVSTPKPLQSGDGLGLAGNTSWEQFGSSHYTSSFSFAPAQ